MASTSRSAAEDVVAPAAIAPAGMGTAALAASGMGPAAAGFERSNLHEESLRTFAERMTLHRRTQKLPLFCHVAQLTSERKMLLEHIASLEATQSQQEAQLIHLENREAAALSKNARLDARLEETASSMEYLITGASETVNNNSVLRQRADGLDKRCRELVKRLVQQSDFAHSEHAAAVTARTTAAAEDAIWRSALTQSDATIEELVPLVEEQAWLREQLATALQSAAAAKTTIASERNEKAQVADALRECRLELKAALQENSTLATRLSTEQSEASGLRAELQAERQRCAALKERMVASDAARVDALVVAGRADALFASEAESSDRANALQEDLRKQFKAGAKALAEGARAAELMRMSHSDEERLGFVERTWANVIATAAPALSDAREKMPPAGQLQGESWEKRAASQYTLALAANEYATASLQLARAGAARGRNQIVVQLGESCESTPPRKGPLFRG